MAKQLAVIILNWNGIHLLRQFLPDAVKYTQGDEVDLIVADNGSTDESLEWMANNFPGLSVIHFDENHGFAEGYNLAIKECADYPFVTLLNSDVRVTPGWWRPILDFMQRNPDIGAVQPKIKSFHNPDFFEYAGAAGGLLDKWWFPYCRGRLFDRVERDNGQYDDAPAEIAWASGAALTVRTDLYLKLGGLDRLFFAHMEEIDLCIRIRAAGFRVCFIPDSEVFHVGGASLPKDNPKKTFLNFRNNLLLIYKNSPEGLGRRRTIKRRIIDSLAFCLFLIKGDIPGAKAILRAHADYRRMARLYTSFPSIDILPALPGANRRIVIDNFVKKPANI